MALRRVVEAGQQLHERRFPRTGHPDECDGLPRRDLEIEARKHGHPVAVGERDPVELDQAAPFSHRWQRGGAGGLDDLGQGVDDGGDLLQRGGRGLVHRERLDQLVERPVEPAHVQEESGEHADLQCIADHQPAADEQDRRHRQVADEPSAGREPRGVAEAGCGGVAELPVLLDDAAVVDVLPAERLDSADAAERLDDVDDDLRDRRPCAALIAALRAVRHDRHPQQRDEAQEHDDRHAPVHDDERHGDRTHRRQPDRRLLQ